MIEIRVDGEPIGKGRPRFSRATGRTYTPERTASFENKVAWIAQQAMRGRTLLEGPIILQAAFYLSPPASKPLKWRQAAEANLPTHRPVKRPDFDNMVKLICDALNKVVWVDDSQIVDAHIRKFWSSAPRIEIKIDNLS